MPQKKEVRENENTARHHYQKATALQGVLSGRVIKPQQMHMHARDKISATSCGPQQMPTESERHIFHTEMLKDKCMRLTTITSLAF